jgi:hypothetical protein
MIDASFPNIFGLLQGNYPIPGGGNAGADFFAGWTFLPGGLLFQYGRLQQAAGPLAQTGSVFFPVEFTNTPFTVNLTYITKSVSTTSPHSLAVDGNTIDKTGFDWHQDASTSGFNGFYWTAIGV